jgi:hypothetical protein
MTEAEWLACEEPRAMLALLQGRASDRQLRLFACACCRRVTRLVRGRALRSLLRAIDRVERFADGQAGARELALARRTKLSLPGGDRKDMLSSLSYEIAKAAERPLDGGHALIFGHSAATAVGFAAGHARSPGAFCREARPVEAAAQAPLLRDIAGDPFRPAAVDPGWLTPAVTGLAAVAYEERALPSGQLDPQRLGVLADALEDTGCTDAELLGHLRSAGPHVRGCWALDLVLGKE